MQRESSGNQPKQEKTWDVALKILRYLQEHPRAADTANGILEWWLLKQSISEQQNLVEQALKMLVEKNLILSTTAIDGRKHYLPQCRRHEEGLIGPTHGDERAKSKLGALAR